MSLIVALKHNGVAYIGSDSLTTKGDVPYVLKGVNNRRIFEVDNVDNMFMAMYGRCIELNILRCAELIPSKIAKKYDIDFKFIVNYFIPRIFSFLDERGLIIKEKDSSPEMASDCLVVYRDQIYRIFEDGTVIEIDDYAVIGNGSDFVIGSLESTVNCPDPVERIVKAIDCGIKNAIGSDYPIVVTDTLTGEFKEFSE